MDYHTLNLVSHYLDSKSYIFYALISKDCKGIINSIRKGNKYETKYEVLTSKSLLCYSHDILNIVYDENVKETIIKIGDLDSIKYLHTKTDIIDSEWLNIAAENRDLTTMKWLFDNGCKLTYSMYFFAVCNFHLDISAWLKDNGCPTTRPASEYCARNYNIIRILSGMGGLSYTS